jgi:hypothetical protein
LTETADQHRIRLHWSDWRRAHQALAKCAHRRRRAHQTIGLGYHAPREVRLPETAVLTDERWEQVAPLLPPQKPTIGRPAKDHRLILSGILWVARTGAPWRELPTTFGPWETLHSRYRRWRKEGLWERIIGI